MKIFIINNFFPQEQIGGSELQCWLLAKYLPRIGYQTAYVALQSLFDKKEEEGEEFKIYYLAKKNDGKIKIFVNFYKLLKKEKPDICYVRIFRYLFFLAKICKFLKIPVVFNTSHINDCRPDLEKIKFSWNPFTFLKSIRIILQRRLNFSTLKRIEVITINKEHAKILRDKYNIKSTPIYNSMEDNYEKNRGEKQKQIVWVNNIKERKRPELFIDLVNRFRDGNYKFLMIGNFQNNIDYYKKLIVECEKENKNFKYLGGKMSDEVDRILAVSQIMVNTCKPEGFGNNFIQAWFNQCPTVTLSFDADDIMEDNKIGYHSRTFEKMIADVKSLMNNDKLREEMGKRAREYAIANHNVLINVKKYAEKFKETIYAKKN